MNVGCGQNGRPRGQTLSILDEGRTVELKTMGEKVKEVFIM